MTEADIDKEFDELIDLINKGIDVEENAFYLSNFDDAAYERYKNRSGGTTRKGIDKMIENGKEYQPFKEAIERVKNGETLTEKDFGDNFEKNARRYANESNSDAFEYAKEREMLENLGLSDDEVLDILDNKYKNVDSFDVLEIKTNKDGTINSQELFNDAKNNNTRSVSKEEYYKMYKKNKKRIRKYEKNKYKNRTKNNSQTPAKTRSQKYKDFKSDVEEYRKIKSQRESTISNSKNNVDLDKRKRDFEQRKTILERRMNNPNLSDRERVKAQNELYRIEELDSLKNEAKKRNASKEIREDYLKERERIEELKRKANDPNISKKERKKAKRELSKELNNPFLYDDDLPGRQELELRDRIESTGKETVETFLEHEHKINKNTTDYEQFKKDLDFVGKDFLDIDGNELDSKNKKINTTLRKAELKLKGFISGDYSDYNEYVEAVERLENIGNRDFKFYETDNLFNSNGHLNNVDDLDNLKPSRTVSAKDAFDDWQKGRKSARNRARAGTSSTSRGIAAAEEAVLRTAPNAKKLFTAQGAFGVGLNLFNTVATYKEERKEGKGVISSGLRAGADFALGELLGMKYMGLMAAQAAPRAMVKGIEGLGKLTREKNNMQRHEAFGYASFQDTQQLATMRQSGMEMAKMANYNLQQTLMGNEAKYMHR